MYEIKAVLEFSGAHRLRDYKGKCEDLHGHNWKIEAVVGGDNLDKAGMLIDFKKLKTELKRVLDILDHKHLNDLPYFKTLNPTSENIAKFIYDKLSAKHKAQSAKLIKITVWETATSAASYYK